MADMQATFAGDDAQLTTDRKALEQRQAALDATSAQEHVTLGQEMATARAGYDKAAAQPIPEAPAPTPLPDVPNPKPMGGKDYEQLAMALLGMALVGGGVSKGNWMGALSALNGALKGVKEGNELQTKRAFEEYDRKFKAASEHDAQVHQRYEDILNNRKMTIGEKFQSVQLLGTQEHNLEMVEAARQRSIDAAARSLDSRASQLTRTREMYQMGQDNIAARKAIHAANQAGAASGTKLTPDGEWFVTQTLVGGNKDFANMVSSRFGAARMVPIINEVAKQFREQGLDPREATSDKLMVSAEQSALRLAVSRKQGVERLTKVVTQLQGKVVDLAGKMNGQGIPPANAVANTIRQKLGDGPLQELHTLMSSVGRLYMEAVTMPASNAQMHATAQEWATGLFNENMSLAQIQGAIAGMNAEIQASSTALDSQIAEARGAVVNNGPTMPSPGAAAPAPQAAPMSLDAYLKLQGH